MPETKKTRIVIASVLKPVDDTRMFEKIAQTLYETGSYDIHVMGYPTQRITDSPVTFHPSKRFKRISLERLLQPLHILRIILHIKPRLIIFTTHELLFVSTITKLLLKNVRIVYDVQENYFLNILHTPAFFVWLRPAVAAYVRVKEKLFSPVVDLFLLAEKTYAQELIFTKDKYLILENKLKKIPGTTGKKNKTDNTINLLFSGTLAQSTGILQAIQLSISLHTMEPSIRLTIAGYCAQPSFLEKIKTKIRGHDFIKLIGGDTLVPHEVVLHEIKHADAGFIAYTPNRATANRMPTKLYEYLGYQLPILLTLHTPWIDYCSRFNAHIPVKFESPDVSQILHALRNSSFYTTPPRDVFWETEAPILIDGLKKLL